MHNGTATVVFWIGVTRYYCFLIAGGTAFWKKLGVGCVDNATYWTWSDGILSGKPMKKCLWGVLVSDKYCTFVRNLEKWNKAQR